MMDTEESEARVQYERRLALHMLAEDCAINKPGMVVSLRLPCPEGWAVRYVQVVEFGQFQPTLATMESIDRFNAISIWNGGTLKGCIACVPYMSYDTLFLLSNKGIKLIRVGWRDRHSTNTHYSETTDGVNWSQVG